jgi:uncharacterized protein YqgC (DUF456 family)
MKNNQLPQIISIIAAILIYTGVYYYFTKTFNFVSVLIFSAIFIAISLLSNKYFSKKFK